MQQQSGQIAFWNQLGPAFLLGAAAALSFRFSFIDASSLLLAAGGLFCIQKYREMGFYLSLAVLTASALFCFFTGRLGMWSLVLDFSIAISWFLALLGRGQSDATIEFYEENARELYGEIQALQKQEGLRLQEQALAIQQWKERAIAEQGAKEQALCRVEALSNELISFRERERELNQALNDLEAKLREQESQVMPVATQNNIVPQTMTEEESSWRHQYYNLREQFEEKTEALHLARKELFHVQTELLSKSQEVLDSESSESISHFAMAEEFNALQDRIADLEGEIEIYTSWLKELLAPKKETSPRKGRKKNQQESLPLLIQDKIDQTSASTSHLDLK